METKTQQDHRLFKKYAVHNVLTVGEFLKKFYRPERYTGRGEEYAKVLFDSYTAQYADEGIVWISKHDSVTGKLVSFVG